MKNKLEDLKFKDSQLHGFYRGIVEDNNDPEKLGRCRIRVFGIHTDVKIKTLTEGIPTEDLPWAEPVISPVEGGVSGFGLWSVPVQGAQVLIFFEEGNMMKPRFMASLPGRPEESSKNKGMLGFNDPNEKYPIDKKVNPHEPVQKGENDMHKLATTESIDDTIVKSKTDKKIKNVETANNNEWDEPDPYYAAKYPDNIVFASKSGITIEVDNTNGQERLHIYHPSNTYIEINHEGSMIIRNAKDKFELIDENKKVNIGSNSDTTIGGDETTLIKATKYEKVLGKKKEVIIGNKDVRIYGKETKKLGGNYNLNASIINLNCSTPEPDVP